MNIKQLYEKYKNVIPYLFFGVCTTLINVATYWIAAHPLGIAVMPSTILAWTVAVLFAYVTNRKWVFHSEVHGKNEILKEMMSFFLCRLATGVFDWLCMFICVDLLKGPDVIIKFCSNVVVIILNYIASRLIVFGNKDKA